MDREVTPAPEAMVVTAAQAADLEATAGPQVVVTLDPEAMEVTAAPVVS